METIRCQIEGCGKGEKQGGGEGRYELDIKVRSDCVVLDWGQMRGVLCSCALDTLLASIGQNQLLTGGTEVVGTKLHSMAANSGRSIFEVVLLRVEGFTPLRQPESSTLWPQIQVLV